MREFGDKYRAPMLAAADWLVETQDDDGCWRKNSVTFAMPGEKAYETHVAWWLLKAARLALDATYGEVALRNNDWAQTCQHDNGWFAKFCLNYVFRPVTHALSYVLHGILEAYDFSGQDKYLSAAITLADPLRQNIRDDGFLPGRFNQDWQPKMDWSCLTGAVQITHCWFLLFGITNDVKYRDTARSTNQFARCTTVVDRL